MSTCEDSAEMINELDVSDAMKRIDASAFMRRMLSRMASEQRFLASSFVHTGNRDVAAQLYEFAEVIEAIGEKWQELEGRGSSDRLREAKKFNEELMGLVFQKALNQEKK